MTKKGADGIWKLPFSIHSWLSCWCLEALVLPAICVGNPHMMRAAPVNETRVHLMEDSSMTSAAVGARVEVQLPFLTLCQWLPASHWSNWVGPGECREGKSPSVLSCLFLKHRKDSLGDPSHLCLTYQFPFTCTEGIAFVLKRHKGPGHLLPSNVKGLLLKAGC